jgi:hypothetical protein
VVLVPVFEEACIAPLLFVALADTVTAANEVVTKLRREIIKILPKIGLSA